MPTPKGHHTGSTYSNPWAPGFSLRKCAGAILKGPLTRGTPFELAIEPAKTVQCHFGLYESEDARKAICTTWLGHAGFLVRICGSVTVLFDPIFSERASPSSWVGPEDGYLRLAKSLTYRIFSMSSSRITSTYDHLDTQALRDVKERSPNVHFLVPEGMRALIVEELALGEDRVKELDWWDAVSYPGDDYKIEFVCTPAQHNSGRGILDQNHTLWASWVVRCFPLGSGSPTASVYHAGDTGYTTSSGPCPVFAEIGSRYGPFDFAMVPIWRGASLSVLGRMGLRLTEDATHTLLSTLHASPKDAVSLARDVRARHTLGMHFGTFCGSEDESVQPLVELAEALMDGSEEVIHEGQIAAKGSKSGQIELRESWKKDGGFGIIDVGQTVIVPLHTDD
ncbi:hypothetical protein D9758_017152 [Tetrapyrgos nigripes]|uniref:Metallo-beta-lactamase domain-containing protein n=1 Tax=Tetrapyrgos nigripes TaxID=182062 RepID=A0A8H5BTP9_9AGAR|nr:hypothetical protein D9758_017152 [Tetrapyrgos nigripes]